jgi:spermidine/putrescine-binding protein
MKKSAITTAIAAGFAAALFGLAAPASADGGVDRLHWLNDIQQRAEVGAATSTIGNGR